MDSSLVLIAHPGAAWCLRTHNAFPVIACTASFVCEEKTEAVNVIIGVPTLRDGSTGGEDTEEVMGWASGAKYTIKMPDIFKKTATA